MTKEILEKVNQIWISSDKVKTALAAYQTLSQNERKRLEKIKNILLKRVSARHTLYSSATNKSFSLPKTNSTNQFDLEGTSNVLLLLSLGMYQSDSFIFLPPEMREVRLQDWSNMTRLNIDIVREAVILGPEGINNLLIDE